MSIDIHVGGEYTVADIEKNEDQFLGAEIKVHFTPKSFAQMTFGGMWKADEGFTVLDAVGDAVNGGGAVVESDMRVEVLDIKANGMPTAKGTVVRIGEGSGAITLVAESAPRSPADGVFREVFGQRLHSWARIRAKAEAEGLQTYVSEPSWKKVGE